MPSSTGQPGVSRVVRLPERLVGPFPGFANGGVIAGTLAEHLGTDPAAPVEVRISRPVPVDTDLRVTGDGRERSLQLGEDVLATARRAEEPPAAIAPVTPAQARATRPVVDPAEHMAPGCFVCGHEHPTGLRLQPGRVEGSRVVAAMWTPGDDLAGTDGQLPPPLVWAALDCPTWFAAAEGQAALLGTLKARQLALVLPGSPLVVSAWPTGASGRKRFAGSALHTPEGVLVAVAAAIWVIPRGGS